MGRYIARRLMLAVPTLLLVSFLTFGLLRIVPGDVVIARIAESGYLSPDDLAEIRAELGIDRPFIQQYASWVGNAVRGDLGKSLWSEEPVALMIVTRARVSLQLALMAMGMAIVVAIPLGVISAVKQNTWMDYVARFVSIIGLSLPDFWIATVLILALTLWIGWLPEFGYFPLWSDPVRNLQAMIFPATIVGFRLSAISARMTRSTMLEVLRQDYIRTARSKGLRDRAVIFRHALRNAALPVVTIMGAQLTGLLGGLVVIESIFALPGVGRLSLDAVTLRDYTVVQGTVLMFAMVFIVSNLIVDLSYALIDPRVRFR